MVEMESSNATGRTDWETPQAFFDAWDSLYHFTLDVAADPKNHKVDKFFTEIEDGLIQDWSRDVCWCNPPYGRGIVDKWVKKAWEEKGRGATVVMLLPARTSTKWFHDYIWGKCNVDVHFVRGRLKFVGATNSAMFASMVVMFHGVGPS